MAGKAGAAGNNMTQIDKQLEKAEESLQDMQDSIAEQKKSRKLIEGGDKGKEKEGSGRGKEGGGVMGKAVEFFDGKDKGRDM